MSKPLISIGVIAGVLVLGLGWLLLSPFGTKKGEDTTPPTTLPIVGSTTPRTFTSQTEETLDTLLRAPGTTRLGETDYLLTPNPETASEVPEYQITYHAPDRTFTISLTSEPLGTARHNGEQYLLTLLGMAEAEACATVHVNVTTFWSVNQQYAGRNLRMSFCPNATVLP